MGAFRRGKHVYFPACTKYTRMTVDFLTSERSEEVPFFIEANGPGKGCGKFAVFVNELIQKVAIF